MGMSASQARYLALTARMNDIEYQGQQINQQRTTLSNQINELYNNLLDMSVPTPPSQTDFSKTVYSGTLGASNFTMGTVRPTGSDNYSIDLNVSMAGDSVSKTNKTKTLITNTPTLNYSDAISEATSRVFYTKEETTYQEGSAVTTIPTDAASLDKDIMIKTTVGEVNKLNPAPVIAGYADENQKSIASLEGLDENTVIYVICNMANVQENADCAGLLTKDEDSGSVTNVSEIAGTSTNTVITEPRPGYTKNDTDANTRVTNLGFYTYDGEPGADTEPILITTVEGLKEAIKNNKVVKQNGNGDIELKNKDYASEGCEFLVKNGDSVTPLYTLNTEEGKNALAQCDVSLERIIAGLRHSFNISENDMSDDTLLSNFSVYVTKTDAGEYTPFFIRNSDYVSLSDSYTNIPSYEYDPSGTYTQTSPTDNCKLEFDSTGRITRVGIPNNNGDYDWVDLQVATETDQVAYEEAMKNYNYEKIVYDKRQEEINLQTSIVQQQDKNLELKLTRLDNERTALNTELEAVKKVITDNIDKTYKTFSG